MLTVIYKCKSVYCLAKTTKCCLQKGSNASPFKKCPWLNYTWEDIQAVRRTEPFLSSAGIPTVSINLLSSNFKSICNYNMPKLVFT